MPDRLSGSVSHAATGRLLTDLPVIRAAFGLGDVIEVRYLPSGLMNRNWRIDTARGVFALKRIVDVPLPLARRNLALLTALASDGIPACPPLPGTGGDPVLEVGDRGYCLFPWLEGTHPRGLDLTLAQAGALGALLGRVHLSLNRPGPAPGLPDRPTRLRVPVRDPVAAAAEADRFLGVVSSLSSPTGFDARVGERLERRKVLLERYAPHRPAGDEPRGPFGWTHGDFQHLNVIWKGGTVVGVVDWDRVRVRPFGEEVARSATLLFGRDEGPLDLDRVSAFVGGYRGVLPLSGEDLRDAVERLWWNRMCGYWHLEFHYDRRDHSCDHLFLPAALLLEWWTGHRDEVRRAFDAG